jgi:hypothetical protein
MKRPSRHSDGYYHIKDKNYKLLEGSRQQVWNKTAYKTAGGLTRSQLIMNPRGRIVSKNKSVSTKKEKGRRFKKKGYNLTRKGMGFGPNKNASKKRTTSKRKTSRSRK